MTILLDVDLQDKKKDKVTSDEISGPAIMGSTIGK